MAAVAPWEGGEMEHRKGGHDYRGVVSNFVCNISNCVGGPPAENQH